MRPTDPFTQERLPPRRLQPGVQVLVWGPTTDPSLSESHWEDDPPLLLVGVASLRERVSPAADGAPFEAWRVKWADHPDLEVRWVRSKDILGWEPEAE